MINEFQIYPKLSISERLRLQLFDSLTCTYVDFLLFFEYMLAPKAFKKFLVNKNFVNEVNIVIIMRKLNLYVNYQDQQTEYSYIRDGLQRLDYESVVNV